MIIEVFLNDLSWKDKEDLLLNDTKTFEKEIEDFRQLLYSLFKFNQRASKKKVKFIIDKDAVAKLFQDLQSAQELLKEDGYDNKMVKKNNEIIRRVNELITNKLAPENWRKNPIKLPFDANYYLYIDLLEGKVQTINDTSLTEVLERSLNYPNHLYLIINFSNQRFNQRNEIQVLKDTQKQVSLISLDYVENKEDLKEWLNLYVQLDNLLEDDTRFRKTSQQYDGKSIYKEIGTGYFWYFDNFHREVHNPDQKILVELEVFDSNGNHLGTSDLEGNLDDTTRKPERKINVK